MAISFDKDINIVKMDKCYQCSNNVGGKYCKTIWDDKLNLVLARWGDNDLKLVLNNSKSKLFELAQYIFEIHLDALCIYVDVENEKYTLDKREESPNKVKIIFFDEAREHWIVDDAILTDSMLRIAHYSAREKSSTIWGIYNTELQQLYNEYLVKRDELNKINKKLKLKLSGGKP